MSCGLSSLHKTALKSIAWARNYSGFTMILFLSTRTYFEAKRYTCYVAHAINSILLAGGIPQALWWFPFIYIGICIVGMLAYEATGPKGAPQAGSLLTMCVVMEISLVLFGVMGTVGVSGMIPLWSAIMFIFPAIALILARKHVGWG